MKKAVSLILVFTFCLFSFVSAVSAENKVEMYEELLTGTWKAVWRYLPQTAMALNKISDPVKPVNLFVFPGELAKAGMTVTSYRVSLSSDHNTLLLTGLDGAAILYARTESTDSEE